jgi:hypothetical protein
MLTVLPQEREIPAPQRQGRSGRHGAPDRACVMTWHTQTVTAEALASLLARIKAVGGTVAHSRPGPGGVQVTWTTMTSDITLKGAF